MSLDTSPLRYCRGVLILSSFFLSVGDAFRGGLAELTFFCFSNFLGAVMSVGEREGLGVFIGKFVFFSGCLFWLG